MQQSFWWWQCTDWHILFLSPHLHTPFPTLSPSLISLMVYVDVKHHVYLNCCSQSQSRTTVCAALHNGQTSIAFQFRISETSWTVLKQKSLRIHVPMYITISTIAMAMRQGLENKCEVVVGHGIILSLNACWWIVARVCDGAVSCHSDNDVMTYVTLPAAVTGRQILRHP